MARAEELGLGAVEDMDQLQGDRTRTGWAAAGSILGAIAASSCCILPLVLFSLGAGGAWLAHRTPLAPYQPIFIAATLGSRGYGFYAVYRQPRRACAGGAACARRSEQHTSAHQSLMH